MQIEGHFTLLIYPFRHMIVGEEGISRLAALDERWGPWWRRLTGPVLERALDDTYFFLPNIRKHLLFPEVALLANDPAAQVKDAERITRMPASSLAALLTQEHQREAAVLRLTLDRRVLEAFKPLRLRSAPETLGGGAGSIPLRIEWIDAVLFPQEVGFLVIKLSLDEARPTPDRLRDVLYDLRYVHAPAVGWQLPSLEVANHPRLFTARDLVDFLLQGIAADTDLSDGSLDGFLDQLHAVAAPRRYSAMDYGQVYGQVFRQYSYGCLDERVPEAARGRAAALFASSAERVLYELATLSQTEDADQSPRREALVRVFERGHIALWENWQGLALHDNVVFLGTRPSDFTRKTLAHNVEVDYFHLFLLTLYQKLRLSFLSGELMRRDIDFVKNHREASGLWDAYTRFRNHYWFVEVTSRPQGIILYRQFQRGLGVRTLHRAVATEVRALREYYESKNAADLAMSQAANIKIVADVQRIVEYIEVFLVSVYAAHLTHMLTTGSPPGEPLWSHLWVATAAAFGAIVTAALVLRERFEVWRVVSFSLGGLGVLMPFLVPVKVVPRTAAVSVVWWILVVALAGVIFASAGARPKYSRPYTRQAGE
jgi:hypothetical protein